MFLADIWPTQDEVADLEAQIDEAMFASTYANVFDGQPDLERDPGAGGGPVRVRARTSTYIQDPPFFQDLTLDVPPLDDIRGARVLAVLGDSVTTDHISPAGDIAEDEPGRALPRVEGRAQARSSTPTARGAATTA